MLVASYTAMPVGMAKWLGNGMVREEKPAVGRRYGLSCPLPTAGHSVCCILLPAISVYLTADLHDWLLTSDA